MVREALTLKKEPMIREVCFGIYEGATLRKPMEPPPESAWVFKCGGYDGSRFGGKISIYDAVTAMANTDENRIGGNMGRSTAASGGRHRENRGGSEIKRTEKCTCGFTRNGNIRIFISG